MKKCIVWLLLVTLTLPCGFASAEYMNIAELKETVPARWTQTYETKWRTIDIDVKPTLPEVEQVPVLKLLRYFWTDDVTGLGEGWRWRKGGMPALENDSFFMEKGDMGAVQEKITGTSIFEPPYDFDKKYGEYADATLGEMIGFMKNAMDAMGEPTENWHYEHPIEFRSETTVQKKTGEPAFPDLFALDIRQKMAGIPLYGHALRGVENPARGEVISNNGSIRMLYCTADIVKFMGRKFIEVESLAQDVPLCDFSLVQKSLEDEIVAGHVRKIFDMDFGYVLYNEPGAVHKSGQFLPAETPFYAVPAWVVQCYCIESPKTNMRDYTGLDASERNVSEYKMLIINAQTGEVMDRSNHKKGCVDFDGFISWEDVGGKK